MTSQELVELLLAKNEEQGLHLVKTQLPLFSETEQWQLVYLLKYEADRQWVKDPAISYRLSGYILLIGILTQDKGYHALGLLARGDALRRMDHYQEALQFLDAAAKEFLEIDDEVNWARVQLPRVSTCLQLNRTAEALRDAAAAREIFMRHDKLRRAGQIDVNAGIVNLELGQHEQALRLFDRAIETYLLLGEGVELHIARARGNKAVTLTRLGKFREAVALHEQARATFAAHKDQAIDVAREELNIAMIYAFQGHYSHALLLFNQSRETFQQHHMQFEAAEVAQHICDCLVRLNRAREAYELAGEAVAFFRTSPGHRANLAHSLMYQASAAMLESNFADADTMLREARAILEDLGFMALAAVVRLQQADLYFANGQLAESQHEAQLVADAFAEQEALPQLARAGLLQARIATALGDTETAELLCGHALDIAQGQGLLDLRYRCDFLLGQIAEFRQNFDAAAHYYDRAVQGVDDLQSRLVMDERTSFLEDKEALYQRAVALALKRGNPAQALTYVEKAKSRVLGDYLRNNIDIRLRAGDRAGEAILDELAKLREEQAWYSTVVYETENEVNLSDTAFIRIHGVDPGQARQEMQKRERDIEQLLEKMQLRMAGDLVARQQPRWSDRIVTSIWPKLERNMLVLEYYLSGQDLYIFQLSRDGVDVQTVEGAVPRLERLLSLWRVNLDLASQAAGSDDRMSSFAGLQENSLGLLQRLYDLLLAPVSAALEGCEHLIIVPYGMLHYLPFHCLFDGVQFVIERLYISYLPAAALLDICRQRGQRIKFRGVSPPASLVLGLSDGGRLPYAVQEAQAVANQLGARCALNEAAKTNLLWLAAPGSPILHIAAHGLFRLDAPNFSYIRLADGQLDTIDVFNLDLSNCSLITLSACETGRAVIGGVDEVIGLGRGFLYAGAASLLPTLWKVDDASSAEQMAMFYQALLSGYSKAAALASAQRAFLARARTSVRPYRIHPYFWAAFHLIGDPGLL